MMLTKTFDLLLHTGLRVSELVNLKLLDVDLKGGQIKIIRKGNKEQAEAIDRLEFGSFEAHPV